MTIMIIEDDEALAGQMASFLKAWGYEAVTVCRFDRILEEFSASRPQLVLMDINLPYYDGFYWCSRIRRISVVPILYISSRGDDKDKIMAVAQGGDDYVEKLFGPELLKAKVQLPFAVMGISSFFSVKALGNMMFADLSWVNGVSAAVVFVILLFWYELSVRAYGRNAGL